MKESTSKCTDIWFGYVRCGIFCLLALFVLSGLFYNTPSAAAEELASYYFDEKTIYLRPTEQTNLSVHCTDTSVNTDKLYILWASDNEAVVKVDKGKVTALSFGNATITASIVMTDGTTIPVTCTVLVTNPELTDKQKNVSLSTFESLSLSISKINAAEHITWASQDEKIVTVDPLGKIVGVAPGKTHVTATIGAGSDAVILTYNITVNSPAIAEKKPEVYMGKSITLHVAQATTTGIVWSSSNSKVASVNAKTGKVTGKDAGTAKITAHIGKLKATVTLTVKSKLVEKPHITAILKIVNRERKKKGRKPLVADYHLTRAANARAKEISRKFSHYRPNGTACFTILKEYDAKYSSAAGENIAYGQTTPKAVMRAWMHSSGHRRNILNGKYKKLGVGRYKKGRKIYWVQLFTD